MTNKDILLLEQELPNISPPNMDRWFNYAVSETLQRAKAASLNIREVVKAKGLMIEYQDKLSALQKKHANKDEYGEPISEIIPLPNARQIEKFDIPDVDNPKSEFSIAVEKLNKKYRETIDNHNEGLKFIDEENKDFEPYWVTIDQIPDGLTRNEMDVIYIMTKVKKEKK